MSSPSLQDDVDVYHIMVGSSAGRKISMPYGPARDYGCDKLGSAMCSVLPGLLRTFKSDKRPSPLIVFSLAASKLPQLLRKDLRLLFSLIRLYCVTD